MAGKQIICQWGRAATVEGCRRQEAGSGRREVGQSVVVDGQHSCIVDVPPCLEWTRKYHSISAPMLRKPVPCHAATPDNQAPLIPSSATNTPTSPYQPPYHAPSLKQSALVH
ncbi:hypothetical protein E2C01_075908 [Portunus trituberculatus]|uniref:Uncharacterized protein n=1 Tax=Portunus trituberculatus TaxID=210409 RepID=A0A5B7I7D3_PORTR|nr:hypothetical protein [Portunus trituberculatus]